VSEPSGNRQLAKGNYQAQVMGDHSTATVDVTNITYKDTDVRARPLDTDVLQEALRALERMPLDEVPAPAPLPHGSYMPVPHNPLFVGRQESFKALAEILKAAEDGGGATVSVAGMGGLGKSQLVSEFVRRYGQYFFEGVFWLNFADSAAVPSQVASFGGSGGMDLRADFRHLPPDDQVKEVLSAWQSTLPRLLVFDNCEEEKLLKQWRPTIGGCRVVLTSRRKVWDPSLGVKVLALDVLRRKESISLLGKHRPDLPEDDPDLNAIAEELGDLPLAVDLAGRYLATYRSVVTPGDYLGQLRSPDLLGHRSLQKVKGISPTDHEMDVGRTFALSYEQLDSADPIDDLALALLARAGCLAPGEAIPRDLLLATLGLADEDPEAKVRAEDAFSRLIDLGLLRAEESGLLTLHRLLAAFVRGVVGDEEARPAVEKELLESAGNLLEKGYPEPLLILLPHLRAVTDAAKERTDERAASLCSGLGRCLHKTATYEEARPYLERALDITESVLGEEHPDTAWALNNLALLLSEQGSYEEAWPLYERALDITERALGEEHPDTARSLNNLANLVRVRGSYEEARRLYEKALDIYEKVLGEEHPKTATSLNNLALLLHEQGSYEEARPYLEKGLDIYEKVLGEEHPDTARSLNSLANLLIAQGSYEEARPYLEKGLDITERVLGEEHPDTAWALNSLANLLSEQGSYEEARRRGPSTRGLWLSARRSWERNTPTPHGPSTTWPIC
jgi:tetratricopeptide (TPR) repeat protein